MSELHYLIKNLPESDKFTFHASTYFTLNELNKNVMAMRRDATRDDVLELIRKDLHQVRNKLNLLMLDDTDKLPHASPK